jgi:membrane-associated phospholipid phosphatase
MASSSSVSTAGPLAQISSKSRACLSAWAKDWPIWWSEQSTFSRWAPLIFFLVYWAVLYSLKSLHADHIASGVVFNILSFGGRGLRKIRAFLFPLILTGIIYDSQRFYSDYIRGPIHVKEPYLFDKSVFGIQTSQGVVTPNEYCQLHTHWFLDLITGFAYLVFIAVFVFSSAAFRFWYSRTGTKKMSASEILVRAPAMMWGFFWVNMIGYSTYYWFAAAPPWYVAKYGMGPARMDVGPSQAGCVRFDQLLGTHFFSDFYGRSADVFGAIPSLHVSYPLIAAIFAFRFGALQIPTTLFYLLMCFSAVYLNHHYILDILWGSTYAVIIALIMDRFYLKRFQEQSKL